MNKWKEIYSEIIIYAPLLYLTLFFVLGCGLLSLMGVGMYNDLTKIPQSTIKLTLLNSQTRNIHEEYININQVITDDTHTFEFYFNLNKVLELNISKEVYDNYEWLVINNKLIITKKSKDCSNE